jgi:hypothetical protein
MNQPGHLLFGLLLFVNCIFGQPKSYSPDLTYSANKLKDDLRYIEKKLQITHPALYRYSTKSSLAALFDSLEHAIVRPMKEREFLSILTLLNSKIKDGHTMFLPSNAAMEYDNIRSRFFPFSVVYIAGKLYVIENCSSDSTILPGDEILNINGASTPTVMLQLLTRQIRDGNNLTYPEWILDHYFAAYYSFAFGLPDQFFLELKNASGELHKSLVIALTKDSIRVFRQIRYTDRYSQTVKGQGITFEEKDNGKTAILTIKSFDPDLLQSLYKQDYKHIMDSLFTQLRRFQTRNLILDLRDNQGGDFRPARYLLSYLITNPSRFLVGGKESRLIQPKNNRFTGKVIVLINGGSFSATAIVIAILDRDERGILVGEETGGNKYIISGNPLEMVLPRSKIRAFISTNTYRIIAGPNNGHGVLPTYPVHLSIADILQRNDTSMVLALKLISKR